MFNAIYFNLWKSPSIILVCPIKMNRPFHKVEFHDIPFTSSLMASVFSREERYYLCELSVIAWLPFDTLYKRTATKNDWMCYQNL